MNTTTERPIYRGPLTTDRPAVIPFPNGAKHIDAEDGYTVCGFEINEPDNIRFPATPDQRVSCVGCLLGEAYPGKIAH